MNKKKNNKGFTLMEMLIVVAIIAILIAIAIPTFTKQLESAREAADAANIRSKYAELMSDYLLDGQAKSADVKLTQQKAGWDNKEIEGTWSTLGTASGSPSANGKCTIGVGVDGGVTFTFAAGN